MAEIKDILLTDELDLKFADGDLAIGEATVQSQNLLLLAEKGTFVGTPNVGVGVQQWLNNETTSDELKHAIQNEMESDGMTVQTLEVKDISQITLDATYGN